MSMQLRRWAFLFAFTPALLLGPGAARADDPSDGYFDLPLGCEKTSSEVEYGGCVIRAKERADGALNAEYQELLGLAGAREKSFLRDMQRAWIALRDAQCGLERLYHEGAAHMSAWQNHCEAVMTLRRVQELKQLGTGIRWHAADAAAGAPPAAPSAPSDAHGGRGAAALDRFLIDTLALESRDAATTRYAAAPVAFGSGKAQWLVYVAGPAVCGSGGCLLLVLDPDGDTFRVVSSITLVHLPVRVLDTRHDGRPDLAVFVSGGGILPGYEARLAFDARTYPENPTVAPAEPASAGAKGHVVLDADSALHALKGP